MSEHLDEEVVTLHQEHQDELAHDDEHLHHQHNSGIFCKNESIMKIKIMVDIYPHHVWQLLNRHRVFQFLRSGNILHFRTICIHSI